jgi:tetratricopeptide (TPR) repeat protein
MPPGTEWLAAAIFAVHPVCVESVAWISEQKNTLSLVFCLLATLAYLGYDARRGASSYALALALFLLALGTKTVTATLPATLLVLLWWRKGRLAWRRDIVPLLPWFAASLAAGFFTSWVERNLIGARGAAFDLSAGERVLLAGRVIWFYLGKLFWPVDLVFIYPRWDVPSAAAGWYGYLAAALAATAALWIASRRFRGPLAGWLFFVGSLFPALGFFNVYPFLFSYVADHFQYLACLGVIGTASAGVALLLARGSPPIRVCGWAACGVLIAGLATLSNRQSRTYRDAGTLYRATLAGNPDCWMAHNNLAALLSGLPGRGAEAIAHFREVVRLNPGAAQAHYNLAVQLAKSPDGVPEAMAQYDEALRIQPENFEAHCNIALLLLTVPGRASEARAHFEEALRLRPVYANSENGPGSPLGQSSGPGFFEVQYDLARLLSTEPGGQAEALAHYEEALRIRPDFAQTHYNIALLLARLPGHGSEAAAHLKEALRIQPDYAEAHNGLANLLAAQPGGQDEALAHFREALRIRPDYAEAHNNIGLLLARLPGGQAESMAHFREAIAIRPDFAAAHSNLGVAYAQDGRMAEARLEWETALRLDPDLVDARRNLARLNATMER